MAEKKIKASISINNSELRFIKNTPRPTHRDKTTQRLHWTVSLLIWIQSSVELQPPVIATPEENLRYRLSDSRIGDQRGINEPA